MGNFAMSCLKPTRIPCPMRMEGGGDCTLDLSCPLNDCSCIGFLDTNRQPTLLMVPPIRTGKRPPSVWLWREGEEEEENEGEEEKNWMLIYHSTDPWTKLTF